MENCLLASLVTLKQYPKPYHSLPIQLVVENLSSTAVSVLNPDMGTPDRDWPFLVESFRIAIMLSFGFMSMLLTGPYGHEVARGGAVTLATPIVVPPLMLAPSEALSLDIELRDFYEVDAPGDYLFAVEYGDRSCQVRAEATLHLV